MAMKRLSDIALLLMGRPCHQRGKHEKETADREGVRNQVPEAVNKYQGQGIQQLTVREKWFRKNFNDDYNMSINLNRKEQCMRREEQLLQNGEG